MSFRLVILINAQAEMVNAVDWYGTSKGWTRKKVYLFLRELS
jgi:hypothetical protein